MLGVSLQLWITGKNRATMKLECWIWVKQNVNKERRGPMIFLYITVVAIVQMQVLLVQVHGICTNQRT